MSLKRYKVAQDRNGTWGILDRIQCRFAPFGRGRAFWEFALSAVLMFDTGDIEPRNLIWARWKPRSSAR